MLVILITCCHLLSPEYRNSFNPNAWSCSLKTFPSNFERNLLSTLEATLEATSWTPLDGNRGNAITSMLKGSKIWPFMIKVSLHIVSFILLICRNPTEPNRESLAKARDKTVPRSSLPIRNFRTLPGNSNFGKYKHRHAYCPRSRTFPNISRMRRLILFCVLRNWNELQDWRFVGTGSSRFCLVTSEMIYGLFSR